MANRKNAKSLAKAMAGEPEEVKAEETLDGTVIYNVPFPRDLQALKGMASSMACRTMAASLSRFCARWSSSAAARTPSRSFRAGTTLSLGGLPAAWPEPPRSSAARSAGAGAAGASIRASTGTPRVAAMAMR